MLMQLCHTLNAYALQNYSGHFPAVPTPDVLYSLNPQLVEREVLTHVRFENIHLISVGRLFRVVLQGLVHLA